MQNAFRLRCLLGLLPRASPSIETSPGGFTVLLQSSSLEPGISVKHPNSKSKHKYSTQLMYTAQKSLAVDSETSDIRSEVDLTWDQAKKSGQI